MNTLRYAAAVARLIRQHLSSSVAVTGDEARGVATIERAMFARTRRRRLVALGGAACAAAALIALGTVVAGWRQRPASTAASVAIDATPSGQGAALARSKGEEPLTARVALESGQRLDTPEGGGASLHFSTGTWLSLSGKTSFRVDSQGATQRFSLQHGELVAHVAKLAGAQRFIVDTPDAEIEVRGTRFRLRVIERAESCGAGTRTRLEVAEGAVEVRGSNLGAVSVKAGEVWPGDCSSVARSASAPAPAPAPAEPAPPQHEAHRAVSAPRAAAVEADGASALTAQNDLFAEGVARGRQGDTSGALRAYRELMSRFPSSPLAENAMVERMRLLAETPSGAAEAKRYLLRYPRGFASVEAKKLLAKP